MCCNACLKWSVFYKLCESFYKMFQTTFYKTQGTAAADKSIVALTVANCNQHAYLHGGVICTVIGLQITHLQIMQLITLSLSHIYTEICLHEVLCMHGVLLLVLCLGPLIILYTYTLVEPMSIYLLHCDIQRLLVVHPHPVVTFPVAIVMASKHSAANSNSGVVAANNFPM